VPWHEITDKNSSKKLAPLGGVLRTDPSEAWQAVILLFKHQVTAASKAEIVPLPCPERDNRGQTHTDRKVNVRFEPLGCPWWMALAVESAQHSVAQQRVTIVRGESIAMAPPFGALQDMKAQSRTSRRLIFIPQKKAPPQSPEETSRKRQFATRRQSLAVLYSSRVDQPILSTHAGAMRPHRRAKNTMWEVK
jgi:hypothetical protein